jgi:hypothetical protein
MGMSLFKHQFFLLINNVLQISQLLPGFNPTDLLPPSQLQPQLTLPLNPNQQQQIQAAPNPNPPRPTPIPAQ